MKRIMIVGILLLMPFCLRQSESPETEDTLSSILAVTDITAWDTWFRENVQGIAFVPSEFLSQTVLNGAVPWNSEQIQSDLPRLLLKSASPFIGRFMLYMGFGVIASILSALRPKGEETLTDSVMRLLSGCMVLAAVMPTVTETVEALRQIESGVEILLPGLIGFLSAFDFSASGEALSEGMAALCGGFLSAITGAIVPLALIGGVLFVIDGFRPGRLSPIGGVCFRAGRWTLRVGSAAFLTAQSIKGTVAMQSDTLLYRSAKLAAGGLPYVGGIVSGSFDTIMHCMKFVRSILGLTGILVLSGFLLFPVFRLLGEFAVLRLAAALTTPLGQTGYTQVLESSADMLRLLLASQIIFWVLLIVMVGIGMGIWQG